jgi:PAS domain S-box-containing protein
MTLSGTLLGYLRDARIAPHAIGAAPAWLWAADGSRILWANAAGAAAFGEDSPKAFGGRHFDPGHPAAREISRLAMALPAAGTMQLARLRGFGGGVGRIVLCSCSRLRATDGDAVILVAATEPLGSPLPFSERVRRLFADGDDRTAVFAVDGSLLHAGADATDWLAGHATLAELGAGGIAAQALRAGQASGDSARGPLTLERIGSGDAVVLVAVFAGLAAPLRRFNADPPERGPIVPLVPPATAHADAGLSTELDGTAEIVEEPGGACAPTVAAEADPLPARAEPMPAEAEALPAETEPPPAQASSQLASPADEAERAADIEAPPEPERASDEVVEAPLQSPDHRAELASQPPEATRTFHDPTDAVEVLADLQSRLVERRHPLRFVWQMDADGRFTIASDEFITLVGTRTAALLGQPWTRIAAELGLDADGRIVRATASHDTWSGVMVDWPADATAERLPVALSGLPAFGRDRGFAGYRGFGVCRDADRIAAVIAARCALLARAPEPIAGAEHRPAAEAPAVETASGESPADTHDPTLPVASDRASAADDAGPPPVLAEGRPQLTVVPPAKNVVPFRAAGPIPADKRPALTSVERNAFQEIAKALGARVEGEAPEPSGVAASNAPPDDASAAAETEQPTTDVADPPHDASSDVDEEGVGEEAARRSVERTPALPDAIPSAYAPGPRGDSAAVPAERAILDRMPVAVLTYRADTLFYANRAFFDWTGFRDLDDFAAMGGLHHLFPDPGLDGPGEPDGPGRPLAIRTRAGDGLPVEGRLFKVPWGGETVLLLMLNKAAADDRHRQVELALRTAETEARELGSILDTATDGVIVTDGTGEVLAANRSAEALFGFDSRELSGRTFTDLFAPESHREALDYLDGLARNGVASILNDGREVIGRVREGGLIPLFMTMGRVADQPPKFCAVFRDITQWKRAEEELVNAKRQAEKASSAKSDFLAKISHEIRTPLNAIIGFSEVMMEQRFGPIGNERYRGYLKDIHTSGQHLIALLTDLLDLSKIEAGKLDLAFARVDLNDVTQEAVAIMQPQANRERIIIRTSLSTSLPPIVADARSIRQIVLNLLSNSIKFTGTGGQVIVSTALTDGGEAVLRVRDTGIGMSERDIETALEPFRQLATSSRWSSAVGSGLGLPLTKALAEANRASFHIKSAVNSGTLVEVVFPATRVLAE